MVFESKVQRRSDEHWNLFSGLYFTIPPTAANVFFLIDVSFLRLTKHLKTSSAFHASQHEVLTPACLQLSAGAIFSQAFMSSVKNRTDTHVTDTCVINFTNLYFSRAWITLRCGAWVKSKVTQNDSCSLWNKAYLGLLFTHAASVSSECWGCCLHSSLWSAVIMVRGCGEDFLLDVRDFAVQEALQALHASPHSHSKAESSPAC